MVDVSILTELEAAEAVQTRALNRHVYSVFDADGNQLEVSKPFETRSIMLEQAGRRQTAINLLAMQFSSLVGWTVAPEPTLLSMVTLCASCALACANGDISAGTDAKMLIAPSDGIASAECRAYH